MLKKIIFMLHLITISENTLYSMDFALALAGANGDDDSLCNNYVTTAMIFCINMCYAIFDRQDTTYLAMQATPTQCHKSPFTKTTNNTPMQPLTKVQSRRVPIEPAKIK